MTYPTISDYNMTEGIPSVFRLAAETVPGLFPMFLSMVFLAICLGTYFTQNRLYGKGDFPVSFSVAGFVTSILALLLSLITGVIPTFVIVICMSLTVVGVIWIFLASD